MKHRKFLSTLLALAILLSCVGWTPSRAEETTPDVQTEQSQTVQAEPAASAEQMAREELPEIVAQEAPVNHGHVGRLENEEQDNLNQFIFLNRDGTKTMYLYDHPVKYRDEAGNIHDISLNIADTDDTAYPFRTENNWAVTAFPRELPDGITLESESAQIKMIPVFPENSTTALNHMARRVDEKTVAYTYDSKTAIEYALTYAGFKEEIVVSEYTGQTEYHFFLYTNGLALTQLDGGYYLTDKAGNIKGTIGDIIVFTADQRNNTFGQLQSVTVKENQIYALTIVLDADYLADPNTKYPIRIDPTININYQYSGSTAIEDTTIHSEGSSDHTLYGLHAGLQQDTGIARILMKFLGLDLNALGTGVTITNATVYLYDVLQQTEAMDIYCHVYPIAWDGETFSGSSEFAPAVGQYLCRQTISYDIGATLDSPHYYGFNITSAVSGWLDGTYDQANGIMFKAHAVIKSGETYISKTFASYNNLSKQPILSISYTAEQVGAGVPQITISENVADLDEGQTMNLGVSVQTGITVAWQSSDEDVATVTDGLVTAKKAGAVVITATAMDSNGNTNEAYCTVYVTIADGVYYIKNNEADDYLGVQGTLVSSGSNTYLMDKDESDPTRLLQLWKVKYIADGYYSIRPMYKLDYGLKYSNGNVVVYSIGTGEAALSDVMMSARWEIFYSNYGYVFENAGYASRSMRPADSSTSVDQKIIGDAYTTLSATYGWSLEKATTTVYNQVVLHDSWTGDFASASTDIVRYIAPGESLTLNMMGLTASFVSSAVNNQNLTWTTSNNSAVEVDSSGGITGSMPGATATIYVKQTQYGLNYSQAYTVYVTAIPEGTYFIRNKELGNYVQIDDNVSAYESGAFMELWEFDGKDYQKWTFTRLDDGCYSITSAMSGFALTVQEEYLNTADKSIVQQIYAGTSNQKWSITASEGGAYVIRPKSDETYDKDWCMAASDGLGTIVTDGRNVEQREYSDNSDYKDEWLLTKLQYFATIENYYDHGYHVRFLETEEDSKEKISGYCEAVSLKYLELLGLELTILPPEYFNSAIDDCKGTVNLLNIDTLCNHEEGIDHTNRSEVIKYFQKFHMGNEISTSILWTCHRIKSVADNGDINYNRSCSNDSTIFMLSKDTLIRDMDAKGTLMHELNHQYGANDHYHELGADGLCKFKAICSECGDTRRPTSCVMYNSNTNIDRHDIICEACKAEIMEHLDSHHIGN